MRSRLAALFLSLALALTILVPALALARRAAGGAGQPLEISYLEDGLRIALTTPPAALTAAGQIAVSGLNARTVEPGEPELPYYVALIAAPPDGQVDVRLLESQEEGRRMPVPAVPETLVATEALPEMDGLVAPRERPAAPPEPAVGVGLYPADPYLLEGPFYLGDIRVFRLAIFPLAYDFTAGELRHSRRVEATVTFAAADDALAAGGQAPPGLWQNLVLNADQVAAWYGRADGAMNAPATALPVGIPVFKIEVDADGIYELTRDALAAAGMDVANVNPMTFQMLYRGEPVAYQWNGDDDALFEQNETVRFYGWAFDGARLEKQFFINNVFWLWAGGTPDTLGTVDSVQGNEVLSFRSIVTAEPENYWFASWTDQWDQFPNEPDAWYWAPLNKPTSEPLTTTFNVTLPHPAETGETAAFTGEFSSKLSPAPSGNPVPHAVELYLNGQSPGGMATWLDQQNVNVTGTIAPSALLTVGNEFDVVLATQAAVGNNNTVYLNRLTVEYDRAPIADGDRFIFSDATPGGRKFNVANYSAADALVWDITDRLSPLGVEGASVGGIGPYTYSFGTERSGEATFIATNAGALLAPSAVSRYVGTSLDPAGGAEWVAIAYHDFLTETAALAAHRSQEPFGGLATHVVDAADVINQYGYGLPIPAAVQDYLAHAQDSWPLAPRYALMVGDATVNPRGNLNNGQPFSETQYLLADLAFVDRFQGQIPSDYTFSLLSGDDLLPELAVGRIAAKTAEDVAAAVSKIILYEQNHLAAEPWMRNMLFVSDDADLAGDFCIENQLVGNHMPDAFNQVLLCLDPLSLEELKMSFSQYVNVTGTTFINYRGHGGIDSWAGNPVILTASETDFWDNTTRPVVIVTGDCLDGYFVYPTRQGLAETFFRLPAAGTAAHWSSSGLGLTGEHSALVEAFYDGVFGEGLAAIGDAANYAKVQFHLIGGHRSLVYSFVLQGDPAMQLMRPDLALAKDGPTAPVLPGASADFLLTVSNEGLYPAYTTVTDTLPAGVTFVSAAGSVPIDVSVSGQNVYIDLNYAGTGLNKGLPLGASAAITLTAALDAGLGGGTLVNQAAAGGTGLDADPSDNAAAFAFVVDENDTPIANDDAYNVSGRYLNVSAPGVLANDVDPDGDPLTAQVVTPPAVGVLQLQPSGAFTFEAPEGWGGIVTFLYRAVDGAGAADQATVYIRVVGQKRFLPLITSATG